MFAGGAFDVPGWINMYSQEYLDHYQPLYNLHVDVLRAHNDLSDFPNNSVSGLYITLVYHFVLLRTMYLLSSLMLK